MKRYKVVFEVFMPDGNPVNEAVIVEAGSKKIACVLAMMEISKRPAYAGHFKQIKSVEEAD